MRYFFHAAGETDDTGEELATMRDARRHASAYLCSMISDNPNLLSDGADSEIRVTDANGLALFNLVTICIEAPTITPTMGRV